MPIPRMFGTTVPLLSLVLLATLAGPAAAYQQTQADDYTRYELLDADSAAFLITYDVTATAAGSNRFFNGIRAGAEETVHGVYDRMTGASLRWQVVAGERAKTLGLERARPEDRFIMVELPRPVPEGGEVRLRIVKTYRDAKSYFRDGDDLVFRRNLGIRRNAVVLPRGYALVSVDYPSQVMTEADGRIKVSFMHNVRGGVDYEVRARPLPAEALAALPHGGAARPGARSAPGGAAIDPPAAPAAAGATARGPARYAFPERAFQDREIVYFLEAPESHSFRLYHDYTESRPGVDRYVNVVRPGSRASRPSATLLDTGESLRVETLRGEAITQAGIDVGGPVEAGSEAVVIHFPAVQEGRSARLRIEETYADPGRYYLDGDVLVWDRTFGRPRNALLLPAGWYLTDCAAPALVSRSRDGRVRLDFINDRPDEIRVYLRARHR